MHRIREEKQIKKKQPDQRDDERKEFKMMKIYIVDDDKNVVRILKMIITERRLGEICGTSDNAADALEDVVQLKPDIIMTDLLMPGIDGISFAAEIRKKCADCSVIMLSQVVDKDMVARAYENGVEFYIHKPVNSIEIESVLKNVEQARAMKQVIARAQDLFLAGGGAAEASAAPASEISYSPIKAAESSAAAARPYMKRLRSVLHDIGISGESGSKDILDLVSYLMDNNMEVTDMTLNELCGRQGGNAKSVEQRIRRAAFNGMVSLANKGLEDYADPVFNEYAGRLYNFEQIRREMNYIRGKTERHGNVRIRTFLSGLLAYCREI